MKKTTFIQENYVAFGKSLIYGAGIIELALSNYVINSINLVRSQVVGVYYFAYILFGLLIIFSTLRMTETLRSHLIVLLLGTTTLFFGIITILEIIRTYVDRMNIVRTGLYALAAGTILLISGLVIIIINMLTKQINAKVSK